MSLIILTVILVLVIVLLITSLYVVKQQTVAIIERFGKYQKTATSGIHIRVPLGI
ncbi:TPA: SPFH domain-containing protein, partial [Streptococcus agalactiae]